MPASVMKLFIPSGLIELGMDFVLHAPESWLWRILWYSKWLRSLWMFRINQFGQMRFPFLLGAVMNCCFFSSPSSHSAYKADLQIGNPCGFFFSKAGYLKRGGGGCQSLHQCVIFQWQWQRALFKGRRHNQPFFLLPKQHLFSLKKWAHTRYPHSQSAPAPSAPPPRKLWNARG